MILWSLGLACSLLDDFTQTTPPAPTDTATTTDTGPTWEILLGEVFDLGTGRTPGVAVIENRGLVGWFDGTTLYAGEVPALDPESIEVTDIGLGSTDAGAPSFGYAEQRTLVAWDDGLGYGKIRTLLESGEALEELIVADTVDPGTFAISPEEDGSGNALWRDGSDMVTGDFDRLLTNSGPKIVQGTTTGGFAAVPAGPGEFLAAWSGPPLGEDNTSTALRAAILPPADPLVAWDFIDQGVERTGEVAVAIRADDGEPLLAWVGPAGELYVRAPGVGDAVAIPGSTVVGAPAVAWARGIPVVAWQDATALHFHAVGLPAGEDEVTIPSAASLTGPNMSPRPLNNGTELVLVWEDAGAIRMTEIVVLEH